jgi:hypothetical protein
LRPDVVGYLNRVPGGKVMPEKATVERAELAQQEGKSPTTQAGEFVREEIHHIREGKHGARSAKQAIAIGLSKARRAGVKLGLPPGGKAKAPKRRSAASGRAPASTTRARAAARALRREDRGAASTRALSRQARQSARRRGAPARRAAARKAAATRASTA